MKTLKTEEDFKALDGELAKLLQPYFMARDVMNDENKIREVLKTFSDDDFESLCPYEELIKCLYTTKGDCNKLEFLCNYTETEKEEYFSNAHKQLRNLLVDKFAKELNDKEEK